MARQARRDAPAPQIQAAPPGPAERDQVHGNTGAIKYWPGYLKHVLQEHLKHHGEEIYEKAKALRTIAENTLLSLGKAASSAAPDPVAVMAAARRDLLQVRKAKRPSKSTTDQLSLL